MFEDLIYDGEVHIHDADTAYIAKKIFINERLEIDHDKAGMLDKYVNYLIENNKEESKSCILQFLLNHFRCNYYSNFNNANFVYHDRTEINPIFAFNVLILKIRRCKNDNLERKKTN